MAVLPVKTEPRCKLCQSPHRHSIDELLEKRSKLESLDDGTRVNLEYCLSRFLEWGVVNPTGENVKNHWRKHCRVSEDGAIEAAQTAALLKLEEMDRNGVMVDVNRDLDWLWSLGIAEIRERVARGDKSGISADLLLKVAAEKTRRQHNETQDDLMRALTGGVAQAFTQLGRPVSELPAGDVVEAEFAEVA